MTRPSLPKPPNITSDPDFEGAQTREHQNFWNEFFRKSLYAGEGRFIVR